MKYDVVIVGGGIAGLTSAAFLSKEGYKVLICEKEARIGGLVNSFDYKGFTFDGGIRAIENSGIVLPMLKQLGLDVEFLKNTVSLGLGHDVLRLSSKDSLTDYQKLLNEHFPDNIEDISQIIGEIKRVMLYMDVLYGIENPLFHDLKREKDYVYKTILPWLFKFLKNINKIARLNKPIDDYLKQFTKNQALIDIIAQHFFKKTPASFALSYFSLYLDYQYPKGGTGVLTDSMEKFVQDHGAEILRDTKISHVDPQARQIQDTNGNAYVYTKLIWASDLKYLYKIIDYRALKSDKIKQMAMAQKNAVSDKVGGDSILSVYLTLDLPKSYFEEISSGHFFYTPSKIGLSSIAPIIPDNEDKASLMEWLRQYYAFTTFEISCPVLRDETLAPEGKTGLIVSTLMDYSLVKRIAAMDWYEEFKQFSEDAIITILDQSIYPGIREKVMDRFTATPLTIERQTGNSDGAITGWAFTNSFIPAVSSMPKVANSVLTPFPDIFQAGQWSYSPSGLPISILTGKLAADKVIKQLKK